MTPEDFKGYVHCATGGLALTCGLYNLLRFTETHATRHGCNAALYLGLWLFEQSQVKRHWSQS